MSPIFHKFFCILCLLIMASFFSCNEKEKDSMSKEEFDKFHKEPLVLANKGLIIKDIEVIEGFIRRRNWKMQQNASGLWYSIYKEGDGRNAQTGFFAVINYKIQLLDGSVCYSSDSLGQKKFRIGEGGVAQGLEQGVLLMKEGSKAHFIMPPYLAFGLLGDFERIPPRSTIVYDVELVSIEEQ